MNRNVRYGIALAIALTSDLLDYFGAAIPVIGDVIDIVTIPVLWFIIGPHTFIQKAALVGTAIEFIPGADLIPSYSMAVAVAYWKEKKRK